MWPDPWTSFTLVGGSGAPVSVMLNFFCPGSRSSWLLVVSSEFWPTCRCTTQGSVSLWLTMEILLSVQVEEGKGDLKHWNSEPLWRSAEGLPGQQVVAAHLLSVPLWPLAHRPGCSPMYIFRSCAELIATAMVTFVLCEKPLEKKFFCLSCWDPATPNQTAILMNSIARSKGKPLCSLQPVCSEHNILNLGWSYVKAVLSLLKGHQWLPCVPVSHLMVLVCS